ncbi:hypothetical protein MUB24_01000 [Lederbergia sp. NSJ-179]|uniref:isoprenylcysteine carboxyl methyltransferase family protein n=1 Tax=Lederbergia sp. NSJ-179 TaxID=2931402 RepID=UPI001FD0AF13|nr:isoprenylcysteine carboxylmethyltransferase family protein [Lederbergia sp. NSJ-179]MCJ7839505.1 hypothetical protein [Lederbergia sp. NSJ-179]
MFFLALISFIAVQRLFELYIARKNEKWMLQKGGMEYGQEHYPYMVMMHISFFISLLVEVTLTDQGQARLWPVFLVVFVLLQMARIWVISTLGKHWNTKIIVLPGADIIKKGPFQYVKHPNYMIVTLELLVVPLMFHAYITAIIFFLLNQWILSIRIAVEEEALRQNMNVERS